MLFGINFKNQGAKPCPSGFQAGKLVNNSPFNGADLKRTIKDCVDWLDTLGITLTNDHRHKKYMRLLSQHPSLDDSDALDEDTKNELVYVSYEVHEIDRIRRHLSSDIGVELKDRLLKYVKGPYHSDNENPDKNTNEPRNIGLELIVGGEFLNRGCNVKFSEHPLDPEPTIILAGNSYPVQCKRISSPTKVKARLKDAAVQLSENIEREPTLQPGVAVLDITKIISNNFSVNTMNTQLPLHQKSPYQNIKSIIKKTQQQFDFKNYPGIQLVLYRASWVEYIRDINQHHFYYVNKGEYFPDESPLAKLLNNRK